ncbi:uncharacterized protein RAG0_13350 [Rhynchosporium agropyri]|uniref:BTB domain-containing protein n=1 Tax=Rhynchosporium agropyri TaxID=914238 RepID=A0A1E1LCN2_9HELO|nr:uncharacterized protein RAG0_13350 [Rhynchosporium agropyri]
MTLSESPPAGDTPAQAAQLIHPFDVPAKKALSLCDQHHEMVTIIMKGHESKPDCKYIMHKSVACYYSPVLDKAFNGPFIEGQTQTFTIEDFAWPGTFGAIQSWMYTQKTDTWKAEWGNAYGAKLYALYILADRMLMPKLQNEAIVLLLAAKCLPFRWLEYIYKETSPESKLRLCIIDQSASSLTWAKVKGLYLTVDTPAEFLLDVLSALARDIPPIRQNIKAEDYLVPET